MTWAKDVWPSERARLMSAHMMPIEREAAEATVEILELNSWLEEDLACQASHVGRVPECTIAVTSMLRNCLPGGERPVCAAVANYARDGIEHMAMCAGCRERFHLHWHIRDL